MEAKLYTIFGERDLAINSNNGAYKHGASHNLTKKMEVAAALQASHSDSVSLHPSITSMSQQ